MITGVYEPSASAWVAEQVAEYEASGGARANTLRDTGLPVIIVTMRGRKSGNVRKIALMRVEHEGSYALVASKGGHPAHPEWYLNICADPNIMIQDGPAPEDFVAHEATGDERDAWWERAVAAFPPYDEYRTKTDRLIPILVANRV